MVVILHILIAISSLLAVTYSLIRPSAKLVTVNYISIAATVLSGFFLVIFEPARMLHTCVAGLMYLAVAVTLSIAAQARLARVRSSESHL
jgi:hypothetical protein